MAIKVETTTDSVDDVKRSVEGDTVVVEGEEGNDGAAGDKKPAAKEGDDVKPPKTEAKPAAAKKQAAAADGKDGEDDDPDDEEDDEEQDGKGKDAKTLKDAAGGDKAADDQAKPPRKNRNRRRIEKLERQLQEERSKREDLERNVKSGKPDKDDTDDQGGTKKAPTSYSGIAKPTRDQFKDQEDPDAAFYEALGRWGAKEETAKVEFERQDRESRADSQKALKAYTDRVADAKDLIPDFAQAFEDLEEDVALTPVMQYVIFSSEIGPFISHHLALNPALAAELAELEGPEAIRRMGRLEAIVQQNVDKLRKAAGKDAKDDKAAGKDAGTGKSTTVPPKKTVSQAPKPGTPVRGTVETAKTLKDIAGGDDRLVDHAKFDPNYERVRKEQRQGRS